MMMDLLSVLVLGRPQADTALWVMIFLSLSLITGRLMRLSGSIAVIMGFLALMGGSDLALYLSRATALPVWLFPFLVLSGVAAIIVFARLILPVAQTDQGRSHFLYVPVIVILCWACWIMSILTPDPSSAYAFYQGWTPLYAKAAINRGYFPMPEEMALGIGYLSSGIYYALDVQGIAMLGTIVLPPLDDYAAYNGAVIAGCMAALVAMAWTVRQSWVGLLIYLLLGLIFYRYGNFFRTVMGNNWGDIGLMAAGAAMAALATGMPGRQRAALWVGFAASFLVFSRNFGAAYAAIALLAGFVFCRFRPFPVWLGLGTVLIVFSIKELLQVWNHGLFFPVASRMAKHERDWGQTIIGTLHDWGILPDPNVLGLPVGALWPALVLAAWLAWVRRDRWRSGTLLIVAAPLVLLVAPLALELVTGYRMSVHYSKLYILALLLFPWFPAQLAAWNPHLSRLTFPIKATRWVGLVVVSMLLIALAVPAAWLLRHGPIAALESYRDNNTDLRMAQAIMAQGLEATAIVRDHRIVYFHHEPGVALRYFLGGDLVNDYDFYSDPVAVAAQDADLARTLANLGWPNLYFSYGITAPHGITTGYSHALRLEAEVTSLAHTIPDWVDRVIRSGNATVIIPKRSR